MPKITYGAHQSVARDQETVLLALTRAGATLRSSCRGGTCQTCLMRCVSGDIPARAQSGLSAELVARRYFLPCVCVPEGDMVLADALADDFFVPAQLESRSDNALGTTYLFEPLRSVSQTAAALVVRNAEGLCARFTVSNKPDEDYYFGIFVADADSSPWAVYLQAVLQPGMQIEMREAIADELLPAAQSVTKQTERVADFVPDLALWAALGEGALLTAILADFYARVYEDPQLSPFFAGFTRQRLIEKQYSFLHQAITGNKVYFGNRPRNAHHWMVISDALFEHREELMLGCMRKHQLGEEWIARLRKIENHFRADIVKSAPFPLQVNGVDLPLEGFEELVMDVGAICDGCGSVIEAGERVRYHLRRGTVYCARCGHIHAAENL